MILYNFLKNAKLVVGIIILFIKSPLKKLWSKKLNFCNNFIYKSNARTLIYIAGLLDFQSNVYGALSDLAYFF